MSTEGCIHNSPACNDAALPGKETKTLAEQCVLLILLLEAVFSLQDSGVETLQQTAAVVKLYSPVSSRLSVNGRERWDREREDGAFGGGLTKGKGREIPVVPSD